LTTGKKVARLKTAALLPGNTPVVTSGSLSRATICGATNTLVVKGYNHKETVASAFRLSTGKLLVIHKTRSILT